jgi:hypothetical protein
MEADTWPAVELAFCVCWNIQACLWQGLSSQYCGIDKQQHIDPVVGPQPTQSPEPPDSDQPEPANFQNRFLA